MLAIVQSASSYQKEFVFHKYHLPPNQELGNRQSIPVAQAASSGFACSESPLARWHSPSVHPDFA